MPGVFKLNGVIEDTVDINDSINYAFRVYIH